jgi:hypothetical protein
MPVAIRPDGGSACHVRDTHRHASRARTGGECVRAGRARPAGWAARRAPRARTTTPAAARIPASEPRGGVETHSARCGDAGAPPEVAEAGAGCPETAPAPDMALAACPPAPGAEDDSIACMAGITAMPWQPPVAAAVPCMRNNPDRTAPTTAARAMSRGHVIDPAVRWASPAAIRLSLRDAHRQPTLPKIPARGVRPGDFRAARGGGPLAAATRIRPERITAATLAAGE